MEKRLYCTMTPYFGGMDYFHTKCMNVLKKMGTQTIDIPSCPYIDMARSALVKKALDATHSEVLIFIDHDMVFDPPDVETLAIKCQESEYGVLGVLYAQRKPKGAIIGTVKAREYSVFVDKLYDADSHLGLGFTAIKRTVFEKLIETMEAFNCPTIGQYIYPFFLHTITNEGYLGEDVSFCRRVQALNIPIGVWAKPRLIHRGSYDYGLEDTGHAVGRYDRIDFINTSMPKAVINS